MREKPGADILFQIVKYRAKKSAATCIIDQQWEI